VLGAFMILLNWCAPLVTPSIINKSIAPNKILKSGAFLFIFRGYFIEFNKNAQFSISSALLPCT
jgi:hypothetical protein